MNRLLLFIISLIVSNGLMAQKAYTLKDFYQYDAALAYKVDSLYDRLTTKEQVAQMIITSGGELGYTQDKIEKLVSDTLIGGVVFLKGSKEDHISNIAQLNQLNNQTNSIPLLYSMDAEPSLLNGRIKGSQKVCRTIKIKTEELSDSIVTIINRELHDIGAQQNYAPVVDVSADNVAIKSRSYGSDKDSVVYMAKLFIEASQQGGIIATAKHFPGHGLVKGDTHKQSVFIEGELQEVDNYRPLIDAGVLSIMVAHIVVKENDQYDTHGLPSSVSPVIVTDLLKNELGFKGLIITDAMNIMKAVTIIDNAPLLASKAGCDMLLMPPDERKLMEVILQELATNPTYQKQVEQSVKKILRLKICAGIIP